MFASMRHVNLQISNKEKSGHRC